MAPTLQLPQKDSYWFIEIYLRLCSHCPPYIEDTPKLWWWSSNKKILKHVSAGITVLSVQEKDRKLAEARERRGEERCRRKWGWTVGIQSKWFLPAPNTFSNSNIDINAFLSIFLKKSHGVCTVESSLAHCCRSQVWVPWKVCRYCSGQPRSTWSQQQSSCPSTVWAGDSTRDSHGCYCSPKTFSGSMEKRCRFFCSRVGGIYSQLHSVES